MLTPLSASLTLVDQYGAWSIRFLEVLTFSHVVPSFRWPLINDLSGTSGNLQGILSSVLKSKNGSQGHPQDSIRCWQCRQLIVELWENSISGSPNFWLIRLKSMNFFWSAFQSGSSWTRQSKKTFSKVFFLFFRKIIIRINCKIYLDSYFNLDNTRNCIFGYVADNDVRWAAIERRKIRF